MVLINQGLLFKPSELFLLPQAKIIVKRKVLRLLASKQGMLTGIFDTINPLLSTELN